MLLIMHCNLLIVPFLHTCSIIHNRSFISYHSIYRLCLSATNCHVLIIDYLFCVKMIQSNISSLYFFFDSALFTPMHISEFIMSFMNMHCFLSSLIVKVTLITGKPGKKRKRRRSRSHCFA